MNRKIERRLEPRSFPSNKGRMVFDEFLNHRDAIVRGFWKAVVSPLRQERVDVVECCGPSQWQDKLAHLLQRNGVVDHDASERSNRSRIEPTDFVQERNSLLRRTVSAGKD